MEPKDQIPGSQVVGAPQEGATQPSGTPEGVAGQETADADLKAQLEKAQREYAELEKRVQRDISRLKSTYDKQQVEARKQWFSERDEMESRFHQMATAGMDEKDRLAYDAEIYKARADALQQELLETQQARDVAENMAGYISSFMELGVRFDQMDLSNAETLIQSGYAAIAANRQEMLDKIAELEKRPGPQQQTPPTPSGPPKAPSVVTSHGPTLGGLKPFGAVLKSLSEQYGYTIDDREFGRLLQDGTIDPKILAEIDPNTF